jgi:DNA ligase (NAD+)
MNASKEEIASLYDFGDIMAENTAAYFAIEENRELVKRLQSVGLKMEYEQVVRSDRLSGMTFVLSGGLDTMSRDEAGAAIERLGGKVSGSVSKKTSYLILGDKPGSKLVKAQSLGIPVIEEDEFLKMLGQQLPF